MHSTFLQTKDDGLSPRRIVRAGRPPTLHFSLANAAHCKHASCCQHSRGHANPTEGAVRRGKHTPRKRHAKCTMHFSHYWRRSARTNEAPSPTQSSRYHLPARMRPISHVPRSVLTSLRPLRSRGRLFCVAIVRRSPAYGGGCSFRCQLLRC